MRDNDWLKKRMNDLWETLFYDLEKKNNVNIRFKGKWRNKFGHIKLLKSKDTEIAINGYFKNDFIPEFIIDITIAHEIIHYMHGFNSPHPKQFRYPHQNGIVTKELKNRGFEHMLKLEKEWIKNDWKNIVLNEFKPKKNWISLIFKKQKTY